LSKVSFLDELTINQIAAGEVIERPASVVKELVENSIDAGANKIEIHLANGGRQKIQVIDDGEGMEKEDALLALERHATSKISKYQDLADLTSLGFRGEAIPSIAAVSRLTLKTSASPERPGTIIIVEGGEVVSIERQGMPKGTNILVEDIFYNTPARSKFLKTIPTEVNQAKEVVTSLALGHPRISFRLYHQNMELLNTIGGDNLYRTVNQVFNPTVTKDLIPVEGSFGPLRISGFVGRPTIAKSNRIHQYFYLNKRYFNSRMISSAAEKAYGTLLPVARFPFLLLNLELPPEMVDVNVHPNKLQVKFKDEKEIFRGIFRLIKDNLQSKLIDTPWITRYEPSSRPSTYMTARSFNSAVHEDLPLWVDGTVAKEKTPDLTGLVKEEIKSELAPELPEHRTPQGTPTHVSEEASFSSRLENSQMAVKSLSPEKDVSLDGKIISLFRTYLLLEQEDSLLLIDQHAAHERIIYERLLKETDAPAQFLLTPLTIEFSTDQYQTVLAQAELLQELGFEFEEFGPQTIILRSAPQGLTASEAQELFYDIISEWASTGEIKRTIQRKEALMTMACRKAIKAGDTITQEEAEALLIDLRKTELPQTCPHGRPTMVSLTKEEIERIFKRR